jgi:geranylgeranyl diphosphate synthase type II
VSAVQEPNELAVDLAAWLAARRGEVDALIERRLPALPAGNDPGRLVEAMRYSVLAPGKRLRPLLAMAAAEAVGAELGEAVRLAAASVELVHCYSLIHDDLPCMDDDDYRRGKPTSHKVFGQATAILAGDALLTLAFEWLAEAGATPGSRPGDFLRATSALARGAGMWGMVRGQSRDLGEAPASTIADLEQLHREKTAALFKAALTVGASAAGASARQIAALETYGDSYGLAFQHADDLADTDNIEFAERARARVGALADEAVTAVSGFGGRANVLFWLAQNLKRDGGRIQSGPS